MTGTFCKAMLASNPDPSEGGGGGGGPPYMAIWDMLVSFFSAKIPELG